MVMAAARMARGREIERPCLFIRGARGGRAWPPAPRMGRVMMAVCWQAACQGIGLMQPPQRPVHEPPLLGTPLTPHCEGVAGHACAEGGWQGKAAQPVAGSSAAWLPPRGDAQREGSAIS